MRSSRSSSHAACACATSLARVSSPSGRPPEAPPVPLPLPPRPPEARRQRRLLIAARAHQGPMIATTHSPASTSPNTAHGLLPEALVPAAIAPLGSPNSFPRATRIAGEIVCLDVAELVAPGLAPVVGAAVAE